MKKLVLPNDIILGEVEKLLRSGTVVTLKTKGNSMLPFIVGGRDSVVLVPYSDRPKVGDIVLAHLPDNVYVLHRVIFIDNNGNVKLMGDGNLRGTESCRTDDLCGRVVTIVKPDRNVDPYSRSSVLLSSIWLRIIPLRRIILALYRRLVLRKQ